MKETSVRKALLAKREKSLLTREGAVSTGSTLLNLACTDHPDLGFMKGAYYYLVGDSASGKTWLTLSCFAEACLNPAFKNYRLIFDDVEGGALMDIARYFGKAVAQRMEPPATRKGEPVFSDSVESFYYHIMDLLDGEDPFIYVLDSQDALGSVAQRKKFREQKKAFETGRKGDGSYGDGKAKYHSENIREVLAGLRRTKSILIIVGQTRDNPAAFGYADKKTRSGGKSLRFYANLEIWTSVSGTFKRLVRGVKRTIGNRCLAVVRKNRVTGKIGKDRAVEIPIFNGLGIDDVGSCVDYLITAEHWRKVKSGDDRKIYVAEEFEITLPRGGIIAHVEEHGLEKQLRNITAEVWAEIEEESRIHRKARYE